MMLAYRLLRLVETHSDALAAGLLERTRNSPLLPDYTKVPPEELRQRVHEIYRHLADWLLGKSELDVEKRYLAIGARRARQCVPLSQLIWAIVLTKKNLWDFLKQEAVLDRPAEICGNSKSRSCWINFSIGPSFTRQSVMSSRARVMSRCRG